MSKTPILSTSILALALGSLSMGAHASEPTGFYAGAGVGHSMADELFADDEDLGYQVFGGYQFNPYLGVEAAYTEFGKFNLFDNVGYFKAYTWSLVAVGTVPFTDKLAGYVKGGFHRWDTRVWTTGFGRLKDDDTDPTYGLGLQYRFTGRVALRAEYSRFKMHNADVDLAQVQVRFDF